MLGKASDIATTSQISTVENGRAIGFSQLLTAATRCWARHAVTVLHLSAEGRLTATSRTLACKAACTEGQDAVAQSRDERQIVRGNQHRDTNG